MLFASKPLMTRVAHAVGVAALGLSTLSAHAVVNAPAAVSFNGKLSDASYGVTGNLFELVPFLFVNGLGDPGLPQQVVVLNPGLSFSDPVLSGFGTGLATVEYRISNVSAADTFNDLRFMVLANPDGGSDFMDTAVRVNGSGQPTDAALMGVSDYNVEAADPDPTNTMGNRFIKNKTLTGGAHAACLALPGCDVQFAMQWNAAKLLPGESFVIRIGLSDNGSALSSNYLRTVSASNALTQFTYSGTGQVVSVPEPSTWALLVTGLAAVGLFARRRQSV